MQTGEQFFFGLVCVCVKEGHERKNRSEAQGGNNLERVNLHSGLHVAPTRLAWSEFPVFALWGMYY